MPLRKAARQICCSPDAKLWSDETPNLYTCRVTLSPNGAVVDTAEEIFGIRMVEWNPGGLFINGKNTLLRSGCIHHDNGLLGAATYAESEDRRVRIMKEAGFNAIRSSHNPASDALLSACDRYGLYVMDESWDMWYPGVKPAKSVWRGTNAIPAWSWRGCEGNKTVVEVYTDAYAVKLFLNGSIVYFDIAMIGENGQWEANADETLRISVTGGELLGFGSANPRTEERYQSGEFATCYGKAQAIIRAGKSGQVQVTVSGKQIDDTSTSIAIA